MIDREPRALAVVAKEIGLSQIEFPGRPWGEHHHQQRALGESMVDRPRRVEDIGSPKSLVGAFVVTMPVCCCAGTGVVGPRPAESTTPSRREIGGRLEAEGGFFCCGFGGGGVRTDVGRDANVEGEAPRPLSLFLARPPEKILNSGR